MEILTDRLFDLWVAICACISLGLELLMRIDSASQNFKAGFLSFISRSHVPSSLSILLLTLIGGILRFWAIDRDCFWFDEALSVRYAKLPLQETIAQLASQSVHPPLYFWILHFWIDVFKESEFSVRALSALFGTLAIPIIFLLGKQLWSYRAGLLAALFFAINPYQIRYAQEARSYSMLVFFALAGLLLLYQYAGSQENNKNDKKFFIIFSLSSLFLACLHIYGIVIWIAQGFFGLFLLKGRKRRIFIISGIIPFAALLMQSPIFLRQISHPYVYEWLPHVGIMDFLTVFQTISGSQAIFIMFSFCIASLIINTFFILKGIPNTVSQSQSTIAVVLAWIFFTPVMAFAISQFRPVFFHRYFIVSAAGIILLAGLGVDVLFKQQKRLACIVMILIVAISALSTQDLYHQKKQNWRSASKWIIAHGLKKEDGIMLHADWNKATLLYYFPVKGGRIINPGGSIFSDQALSASELMPRKFISPLSSKEFSDEINREAQPYSRLWIIVSFFSYTPQQIVEVLNPKFHVVAMAKHFGTDMEGHYDPITTILMERN